MMLAASGPTSVPRSDAVNPADITPLDVNGTLLRTGDAVVRVDGTGDTWQVSELIRENFIRLKHPSGKLMTSQGKLWKRVVIVGESDADFEQRREVRQADQAEPGELTSTRLRFVARLSEQALSTEPGSDVHWEELLELLFGDHKGHPGHWGRIAELALERLEQLEAAERAPVKPARPRSPFGRRRYSDSPLRRQVLQCLRDHQFRKVVEVHRHVVDYSYHSVYQMLRRLVNECLIEGPSAVEHYRLTERGRDALERLGTA